MLTQICADFGHHDSPKCVVQNLTQLLLLCHLQSMLCTIIQKLHVISHRYLTEGTGSLGGGTYSSEVYCIQMSCQSELQHGGESDCSQLQTLEL